VAARYYLTTEALANIRDIARQSAKRWGILQAKAYQADLAAGFQRVASRHEQLPKKAVGVGEFRLHRIHHHYAVFLVLAADRVVIVSVLHERMDVSTRLHAVRAQLDRDVAEVRRTILKDNLSGED
jgi:plasmid stabilization system protein ParE